MSKLYSNYINLKENDNQKIYLFKSGIFYIALEDDAKLLHEIFGFKITNLNENIIKCGFPEKRLEYYLNRLELSKINFEIVNSNYIKIENYSDYLNNEKIKNIITSIKELDMDTISFKDAFNFLINIKEKLEEQKKT